MKGVNYEFLLDFRWLKSAFINLVHNAGNEGKELDRADLAASFQASVVEVLVTKTIHVLAKSYPVK